MRADLDSTQAVLQPGLVATDLGSERHRPGWISSAARGALQGTGLRF